MYSDGARAVMAISKPARRSHTLPCVSVLQSLAMGCTLSGSSAKCLENDAEPHVVVALTLEVNVQIRAGRDSAVGISTR